MDGTDLVAGHWSQHIWLDRFFSTSRQVDPSEGPAVSSAVEAGLTSPAIDKAGSSRPVRLQADQYDQSWSRAAAGARPCHVFRNADGESTFRRGLQATPGERRALGRALGRAHLSQETGKGPHLSLSWEKAPFPVSGKGKGLSQFQGKGQAPFPFLGKVRVSWEGRALLVDHGFLVIGLQTTQSARHNPHPLASNSSTL